jgi:DNA-binding MarR family transcriptional regulator
MRDATAIPIPASAIADRDLSDGAVRVLLYLAHRTADGSELVMRHQDITAELNQSISTVARSLDVLAARGYIARGRDRSVRGSPARIRVTERARARRAAAGRDGS